jgi:hypothetical protein
VKSEIPDLTFRGYRLTLGKRGYYLEFRDGKALSLFAPYCACTGTVFDNSPASSWRPTPSADSRADAEAANKTIAALRPVPAAKRLKLG